MESDMFESEHQGGGGRRTTNPPQEDLEINGGCPLNCQADAMRGVLHWESTYLTYRVPPYQVNGHYISQHEVIYVQTTLRVIDGVVETAIRKWKSDIEVPLDDIGDEELRKNLLILIEYMEGVARGSHEILNYSMGLFAPFNRESWELREMTPTMFHWCYRLSDTGGVSVHVVLDLKRETGEDGWEYYPMENDSHIRTCHGSLVLHYSAPGAVLDVIEGEVSCVTDLREILEKVIEKGEEFSSNLQGGLHNFKEDVVLGK